MAGMGRWRCCGGLEGFYGPRVPLDHCSRRGAEAQRGSGEAISASSDPQRLKKKETASPLAGLSAPLRERNLIHAKPRRREEAVARIFCAFGFALRRQNVKQKSIRNLFASSRLRVKIIAIGSN
jgi:hypothetical protein